jgi:acetyl esterase/lipase
MGFAPFGIRNAGNAGGDPGKEVLLGNSAGAHLASLLALDAVASTEIPSPLRGVAGDSPMTW